MFVRQFGGFTAKKTEVQVSDMLAPKKVGVEKITSKLKYYVLY